MDKNKRFQELKDQNKQDEIERELRIKERWENLKPFVEPYDVPTIPVVDHDLYHEYYVPKLIAAGAIPKKDLVDQQIYIGDHRNATVAKWIEKENRFVYNRTKFTMIFPDYCNHFEDDDGFALFVPIRIGTPEQFDKNNYK